MPIRYYQIILILGSITHSVWGYIVSVVSPEVLGDSFVRRFSYCAPIFMITLFSFKISSIKKWLPFVLYSSMLILTFDYCYLMYLNNFNAYYGSGLYVILAIIIAAIYSKVFLYIYSGLFFIFCVICTAAYFDNVRIVVYLSNLITLIVLASVFSWMKIRIKEQVDEKNQIIIDYSNAASQAAHDIRSPIMALTLVSDRLSEDNPNKKIISDSLSRINYIAESLLRTYRDKKSYMPVGRSVNLREVLESVIHEKHSLHSNVMLNLNSKVNESVMVITKSEHDLYRLFSNIIQNSIESFDNSGEIQISLARESQFVQVDIKDNGKGIPPESLEKVFERGFTQGKYKGTGLGLAHAKEYIESIGGSIAISSKVGKGTLVTIRMPIA